MVDIEIGVPRGQCLDRRIDDPKRLRREITVWERQRNAARSRIKWMFTTDKARAKIARPIPPLPENDSHCDEVLVAHEFDSRDEIGDFALPRSDTPSSHVPEPQRMFRVQLTE